MHTSGVVSDGDRRAFERQVAALRTAEHDDEGSLEWRHALHVALDAERKRIGVDKLKTEGELHRRARSLGLLDRVS